ncbi:catechol 2,3-dioxygenase-like lactoylglutathione lyase family enzyme [Microbacterium ginsengiterrae]|uniref:Catechol 2,3-dioxygenase-like lactoylglutathione lyase family enzyme n=1 Tax=Microbacterium ginsengiterrae TaxID=546115 RepID=A0A7W9CCK7_9MICO|nr:VOC family protein [Microbacterium ginsengiterrae]MBB5743123.1 catechol 2,3-dioxygenase-like lactoylglutathione lyase family enzyme [Microbacterium ginsengiterrae]
MPLFDHLSVSVNDVARAIAQFDPILSAMGLERTDGDGGASWYTEGQTEFIVRQARDPRSGPHQHGRIGWQHLAFAVDSPAEVDRLHSIAVDVGWVVIREPKLYPRFSDRYYASFVEDDNGIRIEFMHNPGSN